MTRIEGRTISSKQFLYQLFVQLLLKCYFSGLTMWQYDASFVCCNQMSAPFKDSNHNFKRHFSCNKSIHQTFVPLISFVFCLIMLDSYWLLSLRKSKPICQEFGMILKSKLSEVGTCTDLLLNNKFISWTASNENMLGLLLMCIFPVSEQTQ